ncbi:carboxylate-amine ligase [Palleronia sediminis]|uniref:Putative glutamate--cysteine ligase 2 n=1 Tax=Palleronia sediminis TaxID=2547833 RepID=A0A4R6A6W2_9RHOB|nr:carboxylate-amine ligase [Palleronia sediminis]TDL79471.1 carboxylate-amine ligase [Palleronia sediminis]
MDMPDFTIGIEEEYLLVDAGTFDLADAPEALIAACAARLGDRVSPEFLRCQIEIGTSVCTDIAAAGAELAELRATIAEIAADFGLAPIAAGCHPAARWSEQTVRDRDRYLALQRDLAAVGERMLCCGMHVHVGLPDDDLRIDLMNQASYFLPHLLALSASSPFWQGRDTGLASYRVGVFDNLPRTGLPPRFDSWRAYMRAVGAIVGTGLIEDASEVWWDLRPSAAFPTLETRICDACPRLDDVLTLAATIQALYRFLWRLRVANRRWRIYDLFLIQENRWRAQRYGGTEGLIDFGRGEVVPMIELAAELVELLSADAEALGAGPALARLPGMVADGTSAARQRAVFASARDAGGDEAEAFRAVTRSLVAEFAPG